MVDLVIGETELAQIAELRAFAAAVPLDAVSALSAAEQDEVAFRDAMRMHGVKLPYGFRVVYTQEFQPNAPPPGMCHHLSVSVDGPANLPLPEAVETILKAFEMEPLGQSSRVWIEEINERERAINILQLITEDRKLPDGSQG